VGFELATLVVIGTDCIGSYKSNYHTIMTMMAPCLIEVVTNLFDSIYIIQLIFVVSYDFI
jgi:hypothetical protein